jgi:membrane peptidoglycan carboxypeptidase
VQQLTRDNKAYDLPAHDATRAFSRATADQVTSVLKSVVSPGGTGYLATALGRPAAGKTGTTDNNLSAWFVGYTPELTTSVAMFAENPKDHTRMSLGDAAGISRVNGGSYPTRIWTAYMAAALKGRPVADFRLKLPAQTHSARTEARPHPANPPSHTAAPTHRPTTPAPTTPTPTPSRSSPPATTTPPTPTPSETEPPAPTDPPSTPPPSGTSTSPPSS